MHLVKIAAAMIWLGASQAAAITVAESDLANPKVMERILAETAQLKRKAATAVYLDLIRETKGRGLEKSRKKACDELFLMVHKDIDEEAVAALFDDCADDQRQILLGLIDRKAFTLRLNTPPFGRRIASLRGLVCAVASFDISAAGRPTNIKLIQASHPALKSPIKRAVKRSLFAPAIEDGVKTSTPGMRLQYMIMIKGLSRTNSDANVSMVIVKYDPDDEIINCIAD